MPAPAPISARQDTYAEFQSTHWTLVAKAAETSIPEAQEALSQLCQEYWFPIYAFIRGQRIDSHQAKDLTQGFFVHLLEKNILRQANRDKGRFRSFLLGCLTNYLKDQWRKESALKRGGAARVVSIDEEEAEEKYGQLPSYEPDLVNTFDCAWAATLVQQVMRGLEEEYAGRGKADLFHVLKGQLNGKLTPQDYSAAAFALGITREALQVNLVRFKEAFRKRLRAKVTRIVPSPAEIDDEIRHLMRAWAACVKVETRNK